jgi:hypothetical protein
MPCVALSMRAPGPTSMLGVGSPPLARTASTPRFASGAAATSPAPAASPRIPDRAPLRRFFFGSSLPALSSASRTTEASASRTVSLTLVAIDLPDLSWLSARGLPLCEAAGNRAEPRARLGPRVGIGAAERSSGRPRSARGSGPAQLSGQVSDRRPTCMNSVGRLTGSDVGTRTRSIARSGRLPWVADEYVRPRS